MNLSYTRMYEHFEDLSSDIEYRDSNSKPFIESRINAYRVVFFSKFFHEQDYFLDFMAENALKREEKKKRSTNEDSNCSIESTVIKDTLVKNDGEMQLNEEFYVPILAFKFLFSQIYSQDISSDMFYLCEKLLGSNMNIHRKEKILRLLSQNPQPLTREIFKILCEIYVNVHKLDWSDKIMFRQIINMMITNDSNMNIKRMGKSEIRVVSGAIKDLEKLLSTGLDAITEIKKCHTRLKEISDDKSPESEEEKKSLKMKISGCTRTAKGSFSCVEDSFEIILYILKHNPSLFVYKEITVLLSNTLNYNLKLLAGPKCNSLTVENMSSYNFKPKNLLSLLCSIYSEIRDDSLLNGIVDSKDFNLNIFKKALKIITERNIMIDTCKIERFKGFVEKIEKINDEVVNLHSNLVYPNEFLDPLTCEVMREPVKLKTSNAVIDRSTFDMIMVGDALDPFNRMPLDETCIEEDVELLKKLEEFEKENK